MEIKEQEYPNKDFGKYKEIWMGKILIGTYDIKKNGKFIPSGCRKELDEREAQWKVVNRYIFEHIKLAAEAGKLLDEIYNS